MDFLQNPFYILNASPRDKRGRIMELSEERSLLTDSDDCAQASSNLINPRKRLSAEIAWLPGVSPKNTNAVVQWLSKPVRGTPKPSTMTSYYPLPRANILASGLERLVNHSEKICRW